MISLATNWYIIGGCTDSSPFATVLPLIKNITMRIREVVNSLGSSPREHWCKSNIRYLMRFMTHHKFYNVIVTIMWLDTDSIS